MVEYLADIPLPGRMLASHAKNLATGEFSGVLPSFVAGPENRLVAAALNGLIASASPSVSPGETRPHAACGRGTGFTATVLALYGPSGVGKTHLANGLVAHWRRERGDHAASYITAADFRRQLNEAITANRVKEFRNDLRGRQLLAIDDIHRFPNDDYLMQELRYTLDAFQERAGTVVVTSPRPAETLSNLPLPIRSRLASGLSLQLATPGDAARVRIIRYASMALGRDLSLDSASRLAESITGTATQVFGALFAAWAAPSPPRARDAAYGSQPSDTRNTRLPTLQEIILIVAKYTRIPQKQLKSGSRRQSVVYARALAVYLAREMCRASYDQIGRAMGGRDHTTIMHNYRKIERELARDVTTQEAVDELRRILLSR